MQRKVVNGKFEKTGIGSDREAKEALEAAYRYLKANNHNIRASISTTMKDYLLHVQDLNGIGMNKCLILYAMVAICSVVTQQTVAQQCGCIGRYHWRHDSI
jgi:ATP-dependent Lon protease